MPQFSTHDTFGPMTAALYDYWNACRAGRAMPGRSDIDPIDLRRLLPSILLIDVVPPDNRLRFRLTGTRIRDIYGEDYTGKFLDETFFGRNRDAVLEAYESVRETTQLHHCFIAFSSADGVEYDMERLILPLSTNGVTVDKMIALLDIKRQSD